eukprot:9699018-Prorocentrum_lima.AAC.1
MSVMFACCMLDARGTQQAPRCCMLDPTWHTAGPLAAACSCGTTVGQWLARLLVRIYECKQQGQ